MSSAPPPAIYTARYLATLADGGYTQPEVVITASCMMEAAKLARTAFGLAHMGLVTFGGNGSGMYECIGSGSYRPTIFIEPA